jgi:hypothetical protein
MLRCDVDVLRCRGQSPVSGGSQPEKDRLCLRRSQVRKASARSFELAISQSFQPSFRIGYGFFQDRFCLAGFGVAERKAQPLDVVMQPLFLVS